MRNEPCISVVIPVWNSPVLLAKCLGALATQSYSRQSFEVLIVDNGSTDSTLQVARSFSFAKVYSEPIVGSYRARNLGLHQAKGEFVAFTDADCIPNPDWLASAAAAACQHPAAGVLGGRITLFREDENTSRACENYERLFAFDQATYVARGACVTANWMSPRKLLLELGGFDASLKSGGDLELSKRIRAAGHAIVYVPDMIVAHPIRGNIRSLIRKRQRTIGGMWSIEKGRFRLIRLSYRTARACASTFVKVLLKSELRFSDKRGVLAIVLTLCLVDLLERLRLAIGGKARRA